MMLPLPKPTHPWFWYRVRSQPHHIDGFLSQKVVCREDFPIHFQVFPSWEVTTACNIPRTSKNVADLCFPRIRPDSLQVVNTYRLNCVMRCLSSRLRRSSAVPRHVNMSFRKKKAHMTPFFMLLIQEVAIPTCIRIRSSRATAIGSLLTLVLLPLLTWLGGSQYCHMKDCSRWTSIVLPCFHGS